jgi:predicted  nucleic acid-binding Zn-ribbon protein
VVLRPLYKIQEVSAQLENLRKQIDEHRNNLRAMQERLSSIFNPPKP